MLQRSKRKGYRSARSGAATLFPVFKLGALIDGRALGGKQGVPSPLFFDETGGELVWGSMHFAFRYRVTLHPG